MRGPAAPDLTALWAARGVAVVGASTKPGTPGRLAVDFLNRYGYPGRIVPVHPSATEIAGHKAYPTVCAAVRGTAGPAELVSRVDQIGPPGSANPGHPPDPPHPDPTRPAHRVGPVDLALILVPADAVGAAVDDCAAAGVRVAIVGTSGFAEVGAVGRAAQADIVARARAAGMRVVGPNCIGAANLWTGQVASFSPLFSGVDTVLTPGGIAFASASGALGYGTASLAWERGLGLGWVVTTGNEADVTTVEVLAALAAMPSCTAVLGYLEGLSDRASLRALAATGKPAAVLVAGSSGAGARAVASHTGALATPDRVVRAALRQHGVVRVSDVDELLDVGDAFALAAATKRWPAGPRVAVLTTSGGSGILAADAIAAHELTLATLSPSTLDLLATVVPAYGSVANPVDVTATVMRDRSLMARCLTALAADDGVDLIIACFCVLVGDDVDAIVAALGAVAQDSGKPILVARTGAAHLAPTAGAALRAAGLPTYQTPARAVRAAAALWTAARATGRKLGRVPVREELGCRGPGPGSPTEAELKTLLASAGIRVPQGSVITDPDGAANAVARCGGRAVLKVVAPGLVHKSDAGGVVLDVTAPTAAQTTQRLLALPGATGVLVEEQVPAGVEVLVGLAPSPLGPTLAVGLGGVLTETFDDIALRLLPVNADDVREMLAETRLARLLSGVRGAPPADSEALIRLVLAVAELATSWPEQSTLDLNPVNVGPQGAVVLDASYAVVAGPADEES